MDLTKLEIVIAAKSSDDQKLANSETANLKAKLLKINDVEVSQPRKEIEPGKAGGMLETVLNLLFGKEVFVKILDILKEIVVGKERKISVTIKCPNGATLEITQENIKDGLITPETISNFCSKTPSVITNEPNNE